MRIDVNGSAVFASTGGRAFDHSGDVIVFIHGSGQNHLGFMLQHRFFANRGFAPVTPDFPGHGQSKGNPLTSIPDMADWLAAFMDATGIEKAHLVGHSQGGLILLELASRHPQKVKTASFVATAPAIPVNDALLGMAQNDAPKAIRAMMDWGHGERGHIHDHSLPGTSHMLYGARLMAQNAAGALYADLSACTEYTNGPNAAAKLTCPCLCVLSKQDRMTPLKQGKALHYVLGGPLHILPNAGHMSITEAPQDVNHAIRDFIIHT